MVPASSKQMTGYTLQKQQHWHEYRESRKRNQLRGQGSRACVKLPTELEECGNPSGVAAD